MTDAAELPQIGNLTHTRTRVLVEAIVPSTLSYLKGHFPDMPVVAGVVQISWVDYFARRYLPLSGDFCGMEQLKFQRLLTPLAEFTLQIDLEESGRKLTFSLRDDRGVFSSGRLLFGG